MNSEELLLSLAAPFRAAKVGAVKARAAKEEQRQKPIVRLSIARLVAILLLASGFVTPALASSARAGLSENSRHGVSAANSNLASASSRANPNTASDFEAGLRRNRVGFPPCPKGASGFFDRHPRLNPRNYSVKVEGLGSNGGNIRVRYEAPRDFPHGFASRAEFEGFGSRLNSGLREAGLTDVQAVFQGSSVTGRSFRTGQPFDVGRVSDFDIALVSPSLLQEASKAGVGLRSGGLRTGPLKAIDLQRLGLTSLTRDLSAAAGRPVNFMIFESAEAALAKAPSILVPR